MHDREVPLGDPITFAVIKNAMDAIVDEVAYTVIRTARSKIVKDVMDVLDYGEESVSVAFEEVSPQDWAEKVYKSDIVNNSAKLYKKPGYTM